MGVPVLLVYHEFAEDYYETAVDVEAVREVFALRPLNEELVQRLNPDITLSDLADDLAEIGYPPRQGVSGLVQPAALIEHLGDKSLRTRCRCGRWSIRLSTSVAVAVTTGATAALRDGVRVLVTRLAAVLRERFGRRARDQATLAAAVRSSDTETVGLLPYAL